MAQANFFRGLATVTFYASDLEAAKNWYSELLGIDAYFDFPGYTEFRIGDYEHELGIIDSAYAPSPRTAPTGAITYWHVEDLQANFDKLIAMGATQFEPITVRGDGTKGFVTASVVDPFGNILGIMSNPHYVKILNSKK